MIKSKLNFPILGSKVKLQLFNVSNINETYLSWLNDKDLMKYSNQRFFLHNFETSLNYLNKFKNSSNIFIAIYVQENFVGTMTCYIDDIHSRADIGILIGKDYLSLGIGFDAWSTLVNNLIKCSVRKITAGTLKSNKAMIEIMRKSGMQEDAARLSYEKIEGNLEDIIYFAKYS